MAQGGVIIPIMIGRRYKIRRGGDSLVGVAASIGDWGIGNLGLISFHESGSFLTVKSLVEYDNRNNYAVVAVYSYNGDPLPERIDMPNGARVILSKDDFKDTCG